MGPAGYWLVIGAGVLSMLSALHANLLAASRVAFAMARDRTLPRAIGQVRPAAGTPAIAVAATAAIVAAILVLIGDVSAAGAASSLIFLISFAMVHWAAILARRRSGDLRPAIVPLLGASLCLALAIFQAFAVREAGGVVALWLGIGVAFYLTLLAPGARLADASAEARDPDLARLRGRSPLVLVPIANPDRAATLVDVAATLRTPAVGRILLLSVVRPPGDDAEARDRVLADARGVLGESLYRSLQGPLVSETLFTVSPDPWTEIARVAREYDCETVLLGMPELGDPDVAPRLADLLGRLDADVVVMRAPTRWEMEDATSILIPTGGRREHSHLRARLIASLSRSGERSLTFLRTLPSTAPDETVRRSERELRNLARDEAVGPYSVVVERAEDPREAILARAAEADLVLMGMHLERRQRALGGFALSFARETDVPLVVIGRRPGRALDRRLVTAPGW